LQTFGSCTHSFLRTACRGEGDASKFASINRIPALAERNRHLLVAGLKEREREKERKRATTTGNLRRR